MPGPVLELRDLAVSFYTPQGEVQAVRGVDLSVGAGEVMCVVGESGCGKTVMCQSVLRLLPRHARIKRGQVILDGQDVTRVPERTLRRLRGGVASMVFQDPLQTLDPTMPVGRQIAEAVRKHEAVSRAEAFERAVRLMDMVGIERARERARLQPHFFSGGMRQRCVLAAALAAGP
ncbi:MAG: ABC transporter ATP-binding protein, partial [Clostridiales bacterium]|nr:ABC transporter ATP-binding protein [Clostridiales bacterium]